MPWFNIILEDMIQDNRKALQATENNRFDQLQSYNKGFEDFATVIITSVKIRSLLNKRKSLLKLTEVKA